jgi:hypothetical protein
MNCQVVMSVGNDHASGLLPGSSRDQILTVLIRTYDPFYRADTFPLDEVAIDMAMTEGEQEFPIQGE